MQETTVIGNIGKDAVIAKAGEKTVISFSLAVNKKWLDKNKVKHQSTTWFDCSLWRESTAVAEYLKAGQLVWIRGEVGVRSWQAQGGEFKCALTLNVDEIELIGSVNKQ